MGRSAHPPYTLRPIFGRNACARLLADVRSAKVVFAQATCMPIFRASCLSDWGGASRLLRVLITVSPRMYREVIALSLHQHRPHFEVRIAPPETAQRVSGHWFPTTVGGSSRTELGLAWGSPR